MIKLLTVTVLATSIFTYALPAEAKKARENDLVDSYELKSNGTLVRHIGNKSCDVTTKVKDFKISQHPNDAAMIYYSRENKTGGKDLFYLKNAASAVRKDGQCPEAVKGRLMENVKEYTVVSSQKTKIVNMALGEDGRLLAWPNSGQPLISEKGIKDLAMNVCNDQDGFSFNNSVAFAVANDGRVFKVEGDEPSKSKFTQTRYRDVSEFKEKENVCANSN